MAGRAFHLPVWIGSVSRSRAAPFVTLFSVVVFCRAVLSTIIPLTANEVMGGAQAVSTLYFVASFFGLCGNLLIPILVYRFRRRWVFTLGGGCLIVAPLFMALGTPVPLVAGMLLYFFSIAAFEITLNLYLLDHIPQDQIGKFEPTRMFFTGMSWSLGPWLGTFLMTSIAPLVPFLVASVTALLLVGYFWLLRLRDDPAVRPAKGPPANPLRNLGRFFAQKPLRLAWCLALCRSSFWMVFFVYGPLYAVDAGLDVVMAGALISIGSASLFFVPFWGWVGRRYGFRQLLIWGYLATAVIGLAVFVFAGVPGVGIAVLILSTFAAGIVDGGGNIAFLRTVKSDERPEMTGVYTTYRDMGQLLPPGIFALMLAFLPLQSVFLASGLAMALGAYLSLQLSRDL